MRFRIEAFDPGRHDSKDFRCGSAGQDNFLRRTARRQQRDAINAHAIGTADLPVEAAPRPPRSNLIPAVFLSHLAVGQGHQGQGLGRILLVDALQQCQRVGQILGVRLLLLDVTPEGGEEDQTRLHRFYAAMVFKPLPDRPERLFLPLCDLPSFQPGG